jgi:guanylate kinase
MNKILTKRAISGSKIFAPKLYKPLIVVGPSGVGKGTLITKFTELHKEKFGFSVSYTTRTPREGEKDGVHYFFVAKDDFSKMIENDGFIEHCEVHGNFYGTSKN